MVLYTGFRSPIHVRRGTLQMIGELMYNLMWYDLSISLWGKSVYGFFMERVTTHTQSMVERWIPISTGYMVQLLTLASLYLRNVLSHVSHDWEKINPLG